MLSVGLDLHKRYSQVEALEENGERRSGARLVNEFEEIEGFFPSPQFLPMISFQTTVVVELAAGGVSE
jgi:hypothetical protein